MKQAISRLLASYENGSLSRRDVVQALALLAASSRRASAAGFEGTGIYHVSLYVRDLQRSGEFYSRVLARTARAGQSRGGTVTIPFKESYILLVRGTPPRKVDHFGIGIDNFDKDSVIRDLKGRGATPIDDTGINGIGLHVLDPDGFPVQLISNDAPPFGPPR